MAPQEKSTATLTSSQAAEILGVTSRTVRHMASQGHLPFVQIGTWRRFDPADIQAHLKKSTFEKGGK